MKRLRSSKNAKPTPIEITPEALLFESWRLRARPAPWIEDQSHVGKAFARMETDDGAFLLRRLPQGVSPLWLESIQDAVGFLDRKGFHLFPRFIPTEVGADAAFHGGRWYDLTAWAPGAPVAAELLTDDQLASVGTAIAQLHDAGENAAGPPVRFDWLTGSQAEVQRLAWDPVPRGKNAWQNPANLAQYYQTLPANNERLEGSPVAREIRSLAQETLGRLGPDPIAALASMTPTLTHGDLWAEHVRFVDSEVAALIDLDTLAVRPPGGDVAALCADFALWNDRRCQVVLDAYQRGRRLSPEAIQELPRLGALRALGVLRARLSAWLEAKDRRAREEVIDRSTAFWRRQLRVLLERPGV